MDGASVKELRGDTVHVGLPRSREASMISGYGLSKNCAAGCLADWLMSVQTVDVMVNSVRADSSFFFFTCA